MSTLISLNIPVLWHHVREVRQAIEQSLALMPEELRSAAVMTASELLENAIKYGEEVLPLHPDVHFSLTMSDDTIAIEVTNGFRDSAKIIGLQKYVDQISSAPNKELLYLERLQELLEDPTNSGKLGLYRIAFEGRFDLKCIAGPSVVTVVATRKIDS